MESFKELFETMGNRLRSPILGSVIFSALLVNWKVVAVLISSQSLEDKFEFFDSNTDQLTLVVYPLILGTAFSLVGPWFSYFGAILSFFPTLRKRTLAERLYHSRLIERTRLAKEREMEMSLLEEALIQRAQRDELIEQLQNSSLKESIKKKIETLRDDEQLSRMAIELQEAEETRDQAIVYLQQREHELTNQLSQTEAELAAAVEGLREARSQRNELTNTNVSSDIKS